MAAASVGRWCLAVGAIGMADAKFSAGLDSVVPVTETLDPQIHQGRPGHRGGRKKWSAPALLVGERLADRFEIVRGLGQGGMGQVYEALDTELEQFVALKLIRPDLVLRPGVVERFKAEVRIAQRITHTNACRIFDFYQHRPTGDDDPKTSLVFLTMELLLGDTLADRLASVTSFSVDDATEVLRQVAAGLDAAHQAGIVHGDLKPENIVFTQKGEDLRVVVTDFGLAFALGKERDSKPSVDTRDLGRGEASTPRTMGTPAYMAPELSDGAPSLRSDVFAFGLVALEMLTGRRQWKAATTVLQPSKSSGLITPKGLLRARRLAATLPARLGSLIQACLEADPKDRPASAGAILERLAPEQSSMSTGRHWRAEVGNALPSRANWPFERMLSSDGDCQIWLARHATTDEPRIFKLCTDEAEPTLLLRELTLLRLLRTELGRRDDLDRVLDWHFEGPTYFLEMEYSSAGDLVEWAESLGGLQSIPIRERMGLAADVAEALAAIHELGIAHGDLRAEAVLVEEHQDGVSARLSGFGHGHLQDLRRLDIAGISSLEFTSPNAPAKQAESVVMSPGELFPVGDGMPSSQQDVRGLGRLLFRLAVGDLNQAMADGWQELVPDSELVAIIESTVESPGDRSGDAPSAAQLAKRIRQALDTESLDRQASSRRLLGWLAAILLLFVGSIAWLMAVAERQAVRARDAVRKAAVVEWMEEDPTLAAAALLELEEPGAPERAMMRQALGSPLARVNLRVPGRLARVALSPDGGLVALADVEGRLRLWQTGLVEAGSGEEEDDLIPLGDHPDSVSDLQFDPTGRLLLSTSRDNNARIWTLPRPGEVAEPPAVFRGHEGMVWRGQFDPQGQKVVTPSEDRTARVWWVDGSREPTVLRGHGHWVIDARFDPEGRRVVTASRDGTVRIWNADGSGQPLVFTGQTKGEDGWFFHAEFSPDGSKVVAASRDGRAMVWPADGLGEPIVLLGHTRSVETALFRPDGQQVLTSSQDGTARVWSPSGGPGRVIARVTTGESPGAQYANEGRSVLFGTEAGPHLSWIDSEANLRFLTVDSPGSGLKSRDERWMLTLGDTLRIWPLDPKPWSRVLAERDAEQSAIRVSQDGSRIALGSSDGSIRILDASGRGDLLLSGHTGAIRSLALHPKTGQLASGSRDDTVRLWSLASPGESVILRGNQGTVTSVDFHPELDILMAGGYFDRTIRFWNSSPDFRGEDSDRLLAAITLTNNAYSSVFGGSGAYLLVADTVSLTVRSFQFDGETVVSEVLYRWDRPTGHVESLRDGTRFATVAREGEIAVWDFLIEGGALQEPRISHRWLDPDVTRAYFDADGQRLVVLAGPVAKIYDLHDPAEEPMVLLGHDGEIDGAQFLPDGRLITASQDRTARIWKTDNVDIRETLDAATDFCIPPELRRDHFDETDEEAERTFEECLQAQR